MTDRIVKTLQAAAVVGMVVVLAGFASSHLGLSLPSNPFRDRTTIRADDPIAIQLVGIKEFHAARGTFAVIVDLEHDHDYVPSFLLGTKATMTAEGTVDVSVDFGQAQVTATDTTVTVVLPDPTFTEPALNVQKTRVVARERGLLDRLMSQFVASPTNDQALYVAASAKIADAAQGTDLVSTGEEQVRQMVAALVAPRVAVVEFAGYGPPK